MPKIKSILNTFFLTLSIFFSQETSSVDSDTKSETAAVVGDPETKPGSNDDPETKPEVADPDCKPESEDDPEPILRCPEPVLVEDAFAFKSSHALWPLGKPYRDVQTLVRKSKKYNSA